MLNASDETSGDVLGSFCVSEYRVQKLCRIVHQLTNLISFHRFILSRDVSPRIGGLTWAIGFYSLIVKGRSCLARSVALASERREAVKSWAPYVAIRTSVE
jgi:hypothetical protein